MTKSEKRFAIPGDRIRQLVPPMGGCLATDEIMVEGRKVGYMYREHPEQEWDSGWRFFAGDESPEYVNDPSHIGIYAVNTVANYDPDVICHLNTPPPCTFDKIPGRNEYRRIEE